MATRKDTLDQLLVAAIRRRFSISTAYYDEVKRRADVVGIFPNEETIARLVGAVLMEQNDDWQTQNRYMQIEGFAEPADKTADLKPLQITPKAA